MKKRPIIIGIPARTRNILGRLALVASFFGVTTVLVSQNRFSQVIIELPSKRPFKYYFEPADRAVVLELQNTSPGELDALNRYDETLVRRLLIKDLGSYGTEVRFVLRDDHVKATINSFDEPFRIGIDFFDDRFTEEKDKITGLPTAARASEPLSLISDLPSKSVASIEDLRGAPSIERPGMLTDATESSSGERDSESDLTNAGASVTLGPRDSSGRKLLQPIPEVFQKPEEMIDAMTRAGPGVGKSWAEYPIYMYRIQLAPHSDTAKDSGMVDPSSAAAVMSSGAAMAEYAAKLSDFGHEGRALVAYQQVLQRDQKLFDTEPLHLWRLAEIHFGQGNVSLADGYYAAFDQKHSEHHLAAFAKMRRLDIRALKLIRRQDYISLQGLSAELSAIKSARIGAEFAAQSAIRVAYWSGPYDEAFKSRLENRGELPIASAIVRAGLVTALPSVESQRTAFVAHSLILDSLAVAPGPWMAFLSDSAKPYFEKYSGSLVTEVANTVRAHLLEKFSTSTAQHLSKTEFAVIVSDYEALPDALKPAREAANTGWAIAESYRQLGQSERAATFYAMAVKTGTGVEDRIKATFWLAMTAGQAANGVDKSNSRSAQRDALKRQSRIADEAMFAIWSEMTPESKQKFFSALKEDFESSILNVPLLKSPPKIILEMWSYATSTQVAGTSSGANLTNGAFMASARQMALITNVAKRFRTLGMVKEEKATNLFLKRLKPADFKDDVAAKKQWATQMVQLAEDLRKSNENLEAGRLYTQAGDQSEEWEARAEALYKGGLLLYNAGRRQEALDAFGKAAQDGSNLFYANLAKERLNQLNANGGK